MFADDADDAQTCQNAFFRVLPEMLTDFLLSAALAACQPAYNQLSGHGFLAGNDIAPEVTCSSRCSTSAAQSLATPPLCNGSGLTNGECPTSLMDCSVLNAPLNQSNIDGSSGVHEDWRHDFARMPSVLTDGNLASSLYGQYVTTSMIPPLSGDREQRKHAG